MTIHYYREQVYGKTLFKFLNPLDSILWKKLTGQQTITKEKMNLVNEWFGVKFEEVLSPEKEMELARL